MLRRGRKILPQVLRHAFRGSLVQLVAQGIDDARAGLIARLEGDFARELFDLLFVEEVAVFVPVFDLFFVADDVAGLDGGVGAGCHVGIVCGRWNGDGGGGRDGGVDAGHVKGVLIVCRVERIAVPVPGVEELDATAFGLGPLVTIGKRSVGCECEDGDRDE